jgi:aspartate aminotransferase
LCEKITKNTKAILINSPNNPTGTIYTKDSLKKISRIIADKEKEYGITIFIISDDPYNKIVYDNVEVPSILNIFKNSIVVNSFSKSLSLPGERIGYIAVNPSINDSATLISGLIFCTRTLGFVNAPALFQKVIAESLEEKVEVDTYKRKRDVLFNHLITLGFICNNPKGAFYLFPKSLIPDDIAFVKKALDYNLLLVPGSGFGFPGYFRIAYCVSMKTIEDSLQAFTALAGEFQ